MPNYIFIHRTIHLLLLGEQLALAWVSLSELFWLCLLYGMHLNITLFNFSNDNFLLEFFCYNLFCLMNTAWNENQQQWLKDSHLFWKQSLLIQLNPRLNSQTRQVSNAIHITRFLKIINISYFISIFVGLNYEKWYNIILTELFLQML